MSQEASTKMEKRRAENLTANERSLLIELAEKVWTTIENKKTDNTTVKEKMEAWQQLTDEYNGCSSKKRTAQQLKQAYENIKKKAKKAAAHDRAETFKTGGGMFIPAMDDVDVKVVNMLGNRATPLVNQYDSSAEYFSQSVSIMAPPPTASTSEGVVYHCVEIPTDLCATVTTATSETTATEAVGMSVSTPAVPPAPDHKKWAGRRRPAPYSKCDVRTATTAKIGQMAEVKTNYIQEKLKMRQAEHRLRMEVLELKRKYYSKHVETPEP